jgi:uncharacterized protein (TIGR03437 family)
MKTLLNLLFAGAVAISGAGAQTNPVWDSSGNRLLSGSYKFRHVVYDASAVRGQVAKELLLYGTITFDGSGNYTVAGMKVDSTAGSAPVVANLTGAYTISASGLGFLSDPLAPGDTVYGVVSNGIFVGASSSSGVHDLLVAAPASPGATTAAFKGGYYMVGMDAPTVDPNDIRDYWFSLNPMGTGALGEVAIAGYVAGGGSFPTSQVQKGVTYSFTNGVGNMAFPTATVTDATLIQGPQIFYVSPDGGFVFGGSPNSFNMFVGVRAGTPNIDESLVSGIYYQAGIDHDSTQITTGLTGLSNYYGAYSRADGLVVSHQRINALVYPSSYDYTYTDYYIVHPDGTSTDSFQNYWHGPGGNVRVGVGLNPYLGVSVSLKTPPISGLGVFINPFGVMNAASFAPFTAGVSPGELVTIFGTNLAPSEMMSAAVPLPSNLNGVRVEVNGVGAPVLYVSPSQVSFLIPFATRSVASIKVINNGIVSNTVTSWVRSTTPGLFTIPTGGVAAAAAAHLNGTLVTETNPARVGETVQLYVSGLGTVNPAIADGAAGPSDTFSMTNDRIAVYIDRQPAKVTYAGLAPTQVGIYQLNVVVPPGTHSGSVFVDIASSTADSSQAYLYVAIGPYTLSLDASPKRKLRDFKLAPSSRLIAR